MLTRKIRRAISRMVALALPLPLWAAPAPAGYLDFSGAPAPAGSLIFGANGSLSGNVPISIIAPASGLNGPADLTLPRLAITGGWLNFNLGASHGLVGPGGIRSVPSYEYSYGGTVTITGSLDGGRDETLLSAVGRLNGGNLDQVGPGGSGSTWEFFLGGLGMSAFLAGDLQRAYGEPPGQLADLVLSFTGTPGGPNGGVDGGAVIAVRLEVQPAVVPEPGSAVLLGGGIGIGLAWGFVRKKRVAF